MKENTFFWLKVKLLCSNNGHKTKHKASVFPTLSLSMCNRWQLKSSHFKAQFAVIFHVLQSWHGQHRQAVWSLGRGGGLRKWPFHWRSGKWDSLYMLRHIAHNRKPFGLQMSFTDTPTPTPPPPTHTHIHIHIASLSHSHSYTHTNWMLYIHICKTFIVV